MRTRSRNTIQDTLTSSLHIKFENVFESWRNRVVLDWAFPCELVDQDLMKDQVNPGFFRAQREGHILPTAPLEQTRTRWEAVPMNSHLEVWNMSGGHYTAMVNALPHGSFMQSAIDLPVSPPLVNRAAALQEALARAQTDAWDTATFLAEIGKTVSGLTTLHSRLARLYQMVFSRSENRAKIKGVNFATALAEVWLELRYMWRPLLLDIQDASEALEKYREGIEGPLCRGWATRKGGPVSGGGLTTNASCVIAGGSSVGMFPDGGSSTGESVLGFSQSTALSKAFHIEGRASVGVQVTTRVATMFDMAVTAWEIVPWSFVFDWFITLGDLIAAFSPFATGQFRYATYSEELVEVCEVRSVVTATTHEGGVISVNNATPGFMRRTRSFKMREPTTVTPTISFDVNLDTLKVVDLVALAWQSKVRFIRRLAGQHVRPARFHS